MRSTTLVILFLMIGFGNLFTPTASGQLIISEFRLRGPSGANDEFIEIYNNSGADHTVAGGGTGYGVAASNGVARCVIPNGTVIPNRGHYLCVNSIAYSLNGYATGNATYTSDIPDNAGIAIFNTSVPASFTLANRLDAVGSASEANTTYKEGTGYPALSPFSIDHSFTRDECGKNGSITAFPSCTLLNLRDTNNNASNFFFNDTNGTSAGAGQRLGTPGPQNLSSPISPPQGSQTYKITPLDTCDSFAAAPNRIRDFTSDPPNNSTFGTLELRLRLTNNTGANTTRLCFRIVDLTTFPAPSGIADLRPRTSGSVIINVDRTPCGTGTSNVTVNGTTLEQPPSQPNGGGFNSSLSAGTVTLGTPIANGSSIDLRMLFGIQQTGAFKLGVYVETLPGGGTFYYVSGDTDNAFIGREQVADFDGDGRTDVSIYRAANGQWWNIRSSDGTPTVATFGAATDKIVPGDYTGDGLADRVVFRPSTGQWFVLRSENATVYILPFGISTDIPVAGDFDGDGKSDHAVYRPSAGQWFVRNSSTLGTTISQWGNATDLPVSADFDGDNKADRAIWRPSLGQWWVSYSGGGTYVSTFGISSDKAVPADYTGDGRVDVAVWRPSNGTWYVLRSEDQSYYAVPFGLSSDLPVPGDYDGDGRSDPSVFRPSTTTWFLGMSSDGLAGPVFGFNTDMPVPNAFVR